MIGKTLGEYLIIEEIGRGGMGVVYLAEHTRLKEKYALKILPPEVGNDPDFVERFFTEARVMAKLDHPNIVRVFNMGQGEGVYFLIMDYVAGPEGKACNLHDLLIERGGRIPPGELREIILQVCRALCYAHEYQDDDLKEGLIHRDLKPLNILIQGGTDPGAAGEDVPGVRIKVSDFGLAKIVGDEYVSKKIGESISVSLDGSGPGAEDSNPTRKKYRHTGSGSIMGTYDYMSPESREGLPVDKRSDIYSLGVMIYYLLTGHKPAGFPRPPSELVPGVPSGWDTIVSRCLQEDPDDRYQTAGELAAAVRDVGWKKKKFRGWKAAGLAVAAGAAGGYFLLQAAGKLPGPLVSRGPAVAIISTPAAARVFLDSEFKGVTPLRLDGSPPGSYKVVLEKDGYNPLMQMIEITEDNDEYSFDLSRMTGRLRVESEPEGAEIFLDGKPMGKTNQVLPGIIAGSHQLLLKREGYLPREKTIEVEADSDVTVAEKLVPPPGRITVQSSPPGADVFINGRDTGKQTTLSGFEVDPGEVTVMVTRAGFESAAASRKINSGDREQFSFELKTTEVDLPPGLIDRGKGYYRFGDKNYPREVRTLPEKAGIDMVLIPPGEFIMGSPLSAAAVEPDESPQHREVITRPFYLGKYEVTVAQFREFIRQTGYRTVTEEEGSALVYTDRLEKKSDISWKSPGFPQDDHHPVVLLTWDEAKKFCTWLGEGYRLPTEIEWEYACRAGTTTRYYWGDDVDCREICGFANSGDRMIKEKFPNWRWALSDCNDGYLETAPAGSFPPNDFRLYDMAGNVWEWCQDCSDPGSEIEKIGMRGGSWHYGGNSTRSANRHWQKKSYRNWDVGFRVARTIK